MSAARAMPYAIVLLNVTGQGQANAPLEGPTVVVLEAIARRWRQLSRWRCLSERKRPAVSSDQYGHAGALAGFNVHDIGLGKFVTRRVALTLRLENNVFVGAARDSSCWWGSYVYLNPFIGPSAQVWIDPHTWVGGGVGLSIYTEAAGCDYDFSTKGVGFDLRAGYSLGDTNRLNLSIEATTGLYGINYDVDSSTPQTTLAIALLIGYQRL